MLWRTDEAVGYELTYGTSPSLDGPDAETREENRPRKRHSVTLARLVRGTSYYYRLRVWDRAGNEAIASHRVPTCPLGQLAKELRSQEVSAVSSPPKRWMWRLLSSSPYRA